MSRATFLLPGGARFGAQRLPAAAAAALGRSDRAPAQAGGRRAQLQRHYQVPTGTWPIAALSRQADAGDAAGAAWLRADPAYLRPDINGVRLMALGESLQLDDADRDALLPALRPLFGDAGFALDAPTPARWYLRLPREAKVPGFADPGDVLGDDVFEHLDDGPEARRWRALWSEAQVVLHHHPWNAQRAARGRLPVNSLWFWGGGTLPDLHAGGPARYDITCSDDATTRALAAATGRVEPLPARYAPGPGEHLFDLVAMRDLAALDADWLQPAMATLRAGGLQSLELDGEDGLVHRFDRWQWLRFWRRPQPRFHE